MKQSRSSDTHDQPITVTSLQYYNHYVYNRYYFKYQPHWSQPTVPPLFSRQLACTQGSPPLESMNPCCDYRCHPSHYHISSCQRIWHDRNDAHHVRICGRIEHTYYYDSWHHNHNHLMLPSKNGNLFLDSLNDNLTLIACLLLKHYTIHSKIPSLPNHHMHVGTTSLWTFQPTLL